MFDSETELVRYTVHADGEVFPVATYEDGISALKNYLSMGVMSRLVIEKAYFCKWASAMSQSGEWVYTYALVWKQVN